jgi:branched-chain amino acid transport system permease protein
MNQVVAGLAGGGVYALIGVCLVLSYRVGAVINFAQTFAATLSVFIMSEFVKHGWGTWLSIFAAVVIGALIAALQGLIMTRFFSDANVLIRSTVTIGMAITLVGITTRIFPDRGRYEFPSLFNTIHFKLGDVTITGTVIASLTLAIGSSLLIWLLLAKTRLGIILRAVAGRPTTAELMGVRTTRVVTLVWAITGALTTAAIILVAPVRRSVPNLALLVIPGLAAAVVGSMKSLRLTVIGAIVLGMLESKALDWGTIGKYRPMLAFVLVTAALLWAQRKETWDEAR